MFYRRLAPNRFAATAATVGPWDPGLQHGGAPVALLGDAMEKAAHHDGLRLAYLSFQFFGPAPVGESSIDCERVRPGARIELWRGRLRSGERILVEASAWSVAVVAGRVPAIHDEFRPPPLPPPQPLRLFPDMPSFGFGESFDWRFVEGSIETPGPATVWTRPLIPLIEDEPLSPLARALLMVDSANGVSAELPLARHLFVPVNLTVSLERHPRGEWVGMSARTNIDGDGVGLTRAELFDAENRLGIGVQTLFAATKS